MADVARRARVSMGTVSNVLNGTATVAPATRERVESAIRELGFVRNGAARSLAVGRTRTIGFVVGDLSNSFFVDMARGAQAQAGAMNVLLANADVDAARQRSLLAVLDEERMAGILVAPVPGSLDQLAGPRAHGRPVVVLDHAVEGLELCAVVPDNLAGGYAAARHLVDLGRRRLLFTGATRFPAVADRLTGVERAVRETGGAVTLEVVPTFELHVEDGREVGAAILARPSHDRPDGVVAGADLVAMGVLQQLLGSELRVPQDVAVIGYDDNRAAWASVVPISTVRQPGEEMGRVAARLLLEEILTPRDHTHRTVVLEPTLVARQSTLGR